MIFITAKDVQILFSCSKSAAYKKLDSIKVLRQKEVKRKTTLKEFCNFYDLDFLEAKQILKVL
jgi:hypothetical protein